MQPDVATTSLAPVVAALRDMEVRHGSALMRGLVPGLFGTAVSGWIPATDVIAGGACLDGLLDAAQRRWSAQPHAAAALAWKSYAYWLTLPGLVGYAGARRVPLPRPANVLLRYAQHQPFLRMALRAPAVAVLAGDPLAATGNPNVIVCADDAALLAELRRAVVDEHLEPLMAGIRARVHLGRRTLLGSLASGVAHGLARAAESVPGPILPTINEALRAFDVADLVDVTAGPGGTIGIERRTCCLAFTLPEPKICTGCCIR